MPPVACTACKQKMSSEAAVCPHCGARSAGAPRQIADVKLSPDEIRALVAVDQASREGVDPPRGLVQTVLSPHPRTSGGTRTAEIALTIACLPIILCGLLPLAFVRRVARGRATEVVGEAGAVLTIAVSGGVGLASLLVGGDLSALQILGIVGGEIALLVIRGTVRAQASASRELMRLGKGE